MWVSTLTGDLGDLKDGVETLLRIAHTGRSIAEALELYAGGACVTWDTNPANDQYTLYMLVYEVKDGEENYIPAREGRAD